MRKRASLQPINVETVSRQAIKPHPKNPRLINDAARAELERGLDKYGLLETITVNRTTGFILSGHQRVEWLDRKNKHRDYDLTVSYVDIDPRDEVNVMVRLNNERAQGEYDLDMLHTSLLEGELDTDLAGIDVVQLETWFPDDSELSWLFSDAPESVVRDAEVLNKIVEGRKGVHTKRDSSAGGNLDTETYFVVVFPTRFDKEKFLLSRGIAKQERYIAYQRLFDQQASNGTGKRPGIPRKGAGVSRAAGSVRSQQNGPRANGSGGHSANGRQSRTAVTPRMQPKAKSSSRGTSMPRSSRKARP